MKAGVYVERFGNCGKMYKLLAAHSDMMAKVAELLERHGLGKYKTAFADVDGDALQGWWNR